MVTIRLRRTGKKKQPSYRVVIADSRSPRDGKFIEIIGHYSPVRQPKVLEIKGDRARYWLSVGAQPSDTVVYLLKQVKVLDENGKVVPASEAAAPEAPAPAPSARAAKPVAPAPSAPEPAEPEAPAPAPSARAAKPAAPAPSAPEPAEPEAPAPAPSARAAKPAAPAPSAPEPAEPAEAPATEEAPAVTTDAEG